ncbi:glycine oxidase ThiO [Rhodobacteraceae bacterium NNCM2]|nr:glycine oxidase ThiO [Coraliihabitans acroporae]
MTTAVVIGAGVAGLTITAELIRAGVSVTVIDRASGLGPAQCSWWAGGMLAPWCERESAEQAVIDLGERAADWWDEAAGGVSRNGTLVVTPARDRAELKRFARRTSAFETLDAAGIAALEPDLEGRFTEALFFPREGHLDPRKTVATMLERLAAAGADFRFGTDQVPAADLVFDCRGLAASDRLADLRGVKGEMLVLRTNDIRLSRPVRLLHPRHPIYIVPREDGLFMLGATMIESADKGRITARSMLELLGAAYALHPAFGEAEVLEIGVDARPAFPDNLPRVTRQEGRIFVNGLYRHGFLLSPATAQQAVREALAPMGMEEAS